MTLLELKCLELPGNEIEEYTIQLPNFTIWVYYSLQVILTIQNACNNQQNEIEENTIFTVIYTILVRLIWPTSPTER